MTSLATRPVLAHTKLAEGTLNSSLTSDNYVSLRFRERLAIRLDHLIDRRCDDDDTAELGSLAGCDLSYLMAENPLAVHYLMRCRASM